ncbi:MAG: hypothetical protein ACYC2Y_10495 [Armatimonadota bacterium]
MSTKGKSSDWMLIPRFATIALAGISGYLLVFIIIPFFLLGIHKVPVQKLNYGLVSYEQAFGSIAYLVAIFATGFLMIPLWTTALWLVSLLDFILTRRWYVMLALVVFPLVVSYFLAGPYEPRMYEWTAPD